MATVQATRAHAGGWVNSNMRYIDARLRPRPTPITYLFTAPAPETESSLLSRTGRCSMPHPGKVGKGGEDAHIICSGSNGCTISVVLDGVGGWSGVGIDSGLYSRTLARKIALEFELWADAQVKNGNRKQTHDQKPLLAILERAVAAVHGSQIPGSCTICMSMLFPDGKLHVLNLGDSGLRVVGKNHSISFATHEQQHSFNYPKQLGIPSTDAPSDGDYSVIDVCSGDIIVLGTDGVWDNLWEQEFLSLLFLARTDRGSEERAARMLVEAAQRKGGDRGYFSPFCAHARQAGIANCLGGKLDDTTALVLRVP
eukprot:CAMPEP_0196724370 /NCGR_PEP_ID=MMETSP1091-20130531/6248_1 /TAXON_ID=302021 /ORGANISM="Rhodomonas sp., Strain CCMP768" /LENGTH=311 /DNA_ID=CAMNT_0042066479 /DNA_START=26 /DNA_END=961 /DNA_ORIENTATION=+